MKIKRGDRVLVIKGKDRGKAGLVTFVDTKKNKVQVEGLNVQKRHLKKSNDPKKPGGLVEIFAPIPIANVMYVGDGNVPTRVGYKLVEGKKLRVSKTTNGVIEDAKK